MLKVNFYPLEGEQVELQKVATHFMGIEAVGGKVFVTNMRVVFKTHDMNIQSTELSIPFSEIKSVEYRNTAGMIPNGMKIVLKTGEEKKFITWKRKAIKRAIDPKLPPPI